MPLVRAGVVDALGERLDPANAEALLKAAGDDYGLVRVRAAAALAGIPEARLPEDQRPRLRGAMAELMDSMKSRPDDMASHYMLLAEMGKPSEAEQAFRTAFKANPRSAQAAYNLGVLLANDRSEEAIDWCRRAASLGRDNPQYGYTYAFYLRRTGKLAQALEAIRSVRERHPGHEDSAQLEQALQQEQKAVDKP